MLPEENEVSILKSLRSMKINKQKSLEEKAHRLLNHLHSLCWKKKNAPKEEKTWQYLTLDQGKAVNIAEILDRTNKILRQEKTKTLYIWGKGAQVETIKD